MQRTGLEWERLKNQIVIAVPHVRKDNVIPAVFK